MGKRFYPTAGQIGCVDKVERWSKSLNKQTFIYTGPAGTGKTTIVPMIMERLGLHYDEVLFVTFTGKAASVLMTKGIPAATIHSTFFEMREVPMLKDGEYVFNNGRMLTRLKFIPKKMISPKIKYIFGDEVGMNDEIMYNTMLSFGLPVIGCGDICQLPALFGESPFFKDIDFNLWEITRQALDSGIITLATMLREGKDLTNYMNFNRQAWVMSKKFMRQRHLLESSIILTSKNKTRDIINATVRKYRGYDGEIPQMGEKLVCRRNNWSTELDGIALVNGTMGTIINPVARGDYSIKKQTYVIDFLPDYIVPERYDYYDSLLADLSYLNSPSGSGKQSNRYNPGNKFEYGYCTTVHTSQGSQYPYVVYYDEQMGDSRFMRRLRYTAVTRAVDKVFMFM